MTQPESSNDPGPRPTGTARRAPALSERVAHLVTHRPRLLWGILFALLIVAGTLIVFRLRLNSEVLDMLPGHFESVAVYKLADREFSSARSLTIGLLAASDDVDMDGFTEHFATELRKEPWVVRVMERSPLEAPGGIEELRAIALPLMLNQSGEDFAKMMAALQPDAIATRLAKLRAKLESGAGLSQAELEFDPLGIVVPAMKSLRPPDFATSADPRFRAVFALSNQADLNEPACKAIMDQFEDFKKRVLASWVGGPAPEILCTGRTAYVAEMSGKLRSDIISTLAGSILLVGLTFWAGFGRWKPLRAIVDALLLSCLLAVACAAALFGSLNMITIGLCAILVGLGVDLAMVLYALYLHERAHGKEHEESIAAALHTHARGIWFGAMTTAAAFLCLLGSGSPGFAQLGVLIAAGILIAAVVMMTFLWIFLSISLPRWLFKTFAALGFAALSVGAVYVVLTAGNWSTYVWQNVLSGIGAAILAVVLVRVLGVWTARVPKLVLSKPWRMLAPGLSILVVLALLALLPIGRVAFDIDPKTLEPKESIAGHALREIMKRLNPDGKDRVIAVVEASDAQSLSTEWEKAQAAWETLVPGVLKQVATPAGLATSPERMAANATKLRALDFSKSKTALDEALAANEFAPEQFAGTRALLDALAAAASGHLEMVEWRRNLPETSAWWFLIDGFLSRQHAIGIALLKPVEDVKNPAQASALRAALAVPGVDVGLSGWGFTLAELTPFSKTRMFQLSVLMVAVNIVILAFLFRSWKEVAIIMLGMGFSLCGLVATIKAAGIALNLFNILAFPLVLGVGVDYSIYGAIAALSAEPRRELSALMKPLLLSGLTTVIGFVTLAWAYNPALSGLGLLCGIGVGWCLVTTFIFVLPASVLVSRMKR